MNDYKYQFWWNLQGIEIEHSFSNDGYNHSYNRGTNPVHKKWFEDTKGVIKSRKSKTDRQYNGQTK
jgi:hypothetical protein